MERKAYPSDVSDDEWAFVAPYLTLIAEDAPQRVDSLREVFNGLRYIVRTGMLRDYERLSETLSGLLFVAFAILMVYRFVTAVIQST